ncbi:hypothetical protein JW887_01525 [Candidatus Dojkabacteria bacterium]|nr:hypothetical protein [Candidatus Dojkabacteria bacterium]
MKNPTKYKFLVFALFLCLFSSLAFANRIYAQSDTSVSDQSESDSNPDSDIADENPSGGTFDNFDTEKKYILYVQEGCPHCAKVKGFIETNGLEGDFDIRNTTLDSTANDKFLQYTSDNEVAMDEIGVPFLVISKDEWISGDQPVIDYLSSEYDIKEKFTPDGNFALLLVGSLFIITILGYGIFNMTNAKRTS